MGFANIGTHVRRQRTITVNGEKIVIVSVNRTWKGSHAGFNVTINGEKFFSNSYYRKEATDQAFVKWVKKHK